MLGGTPQGTEVWLTVDGSDLRKAYSQALPDLMRVRALDGTLVPGYRTINVLGVTPQRRTLLYHRLFSSKEEEFTSESHEVQNALQGVSAGLHEVKNDHSITWIGPAHMKVVIFGK